ncbi:MAG: prepilin-type N-terminal cleavage/methylation domain-containing protein [Planctomycetota bacterium]
MNIKSRSRQSQGFTLIEILLALGVFLVGVVFTLAVFPKAVTQTADSDDDNIAAAFAESLFETLSKGLKAYAPSASRGPKGDTNAMPPFYNSASFTAEDFVWFSSPLSDGTQQDCFLLPSGDWSNPTEVSKHITWFPIPLDPTTMTEALYVSWFSDNVANLGFGKVVAGNGDTGGLVRQMGREALGSSEAVKLLESTDEDLPEKLRDFYYCFSVKNEGTVPNLYHFTLYVYHGGVMPNGNDTRTTSHRLLNNTDPVAKENNFIHKFDFLIGRT